MGDETATGRDVDAALATLEDQIDRTHGRLQLEYIAALLKKAGFSLTHGPIIPPGASLDYPGPVASAVAKALEELQQLRRYQQAEAERLEMHRQRLEREAMPRITRTVEERLNQVGSARSLRERVDAGQRANTFRGVSPSRIWLDEREVRDSTVDTAAELLREYVYGKAPTSSGPLAGREGQAELAEFIRQLGRSGS